MDSDFELSKPRPGGEMLASQRLLLFITIWNYKP
jgi:hypothetical protein